jgi:hypothetical protein
VRGGGGGGAQRTHDGRRGCYSVRPHRRGELHVARQRWGRADKLPANSSKAFQRCGNFHEIGGIDSLVPEHDFDLMLGERLPRVAWTRAS